MTSIGIKKILFFHFPTNIKFSLKIVNWFSLNLGNNDPEKSIDEHLPTIL